MDEMNQQSESENRQLRLIMQIAIVLVFASLMAAFIWYFEDSEEDIQQTTLDLLADEMARSVISARWQWEAEGRPARILQIRYDRNGKETDRRPIAMSHLGWPKVEPSADGCDQLWKTVLNTPMQVNNFRVYGEFFDGVKMSGKALDSMCRFRVSTGPYFDYKIYTGQVIKR
ncbi:hypothetical protein [Lacimicrobium alkaliphilum]|uniref:MSHA biogenesis protein MshF n=1 Tax=Lacimicrobium alkaliphilum TaxID=1526571 RepID=A0A0U2PDB1_9ALTE|nr:hypothetical protein [Lacimicrobium alkaliphilum]ALS97005.1 hypothetical protein AT746_01070 [Lacimicrobium alkaliphilum]